VGIVNAAGTKVGDAEIFFGYDYFTVSIDTTLLGGDDGFLNAATIMGNVTGGTDCAPNIGYLSLNPYEIMLPIIMR
jgi:hypothetical protein